MDCTIKRTDTENKSPRPASVYFVILAAAVAICAAVGIKTAGNMGIQDGLLFYGRYDGLPDVSGIRDVLLHAKTAVSCAVPCLTQLLFLYLFSYSPLLLPAAIFIVGCKGFIAGTAFCLIDSTDTAIQLVLYILTTAVICIMTALFLSYRNSEEGYGSALKKTAVLFICAGACVMGETILSFII